MNDDSGTNIQMKDLRTDDVLELIYEKLTDGSWNTLEDAKKNIGIMIGVYRDRHAAIMESFFMIRQ